MLIYISRSRYVISKINVIINSYRKIFELEAEKEKWRYWRNEFGSDCIKVSRRWRRQLTVTAAARRRFLEGMRSTSTWKSSKTSWSMAIKRVTALEQVHSPTSLKKLKKISSRFITHFRNKVCVRATDAVLLARRNIPSVDYKEDFLPRDCRGTLLVHSRLYQRRPAQGKKGQHSCSSQNKQRGRAEPS